MIEEITKYQTRNNGSTGLHVVYSHVWLDPETNQQFIYVGSGKPERAKSTRRQENTRYTELRAKYGTPIVTIEAEGLDKYTALDIEANITYVYRVLANTGYTCINLQDGSYMTEEGKKKRSEASIGNTNALGYRHTEEAKVAISATKTGRPSGTQKYKYLITDPDGNEHIITKGFTVWCNARNLDGSALLAVAKRKRDQHQQYTARFLTVEEIA